jgi:diguanylate cyclase (GGDEF)-like protein
MRLRLPIGLRQAWLSRRGRSECVATASDRGYGAVHPRLNAVLRVPRLPGSSDTLPSPVRSGRGTTDASERFRERHVRLGVALSLATLGQAVLYLWLGHPHADPAPLLTMIAFAAAVNVSLWAIAPQVARNRFHPAFFVAWSGGTTALILAAAALDGGETSPFIVLLFLPMLYAAQAYPPLGVLLLGAEGILGFALVCAADATSNASSTALMAATLSLASLMAAQSAANREQQTQELHALTTLLESDANHDGLTTCVNRRGLDAALETEVARALRYGRPLSLLLLDIDHLKAINDLRGHTGGDLALQQVASALQHVGRRTDVAARFGGDEFALLAPEMPEGAALGLAERLHAALREQTAGAPVTVSIGVAALSGGISTPAQLLGAADAAMYAAKRTGRDRTATFGDPSTAEFVA